MLAYQQILNDRRARLLDEIAEKIPGEFGMLAQAILNGIDS